MIIGFFCWQDKEENLPGIMRDVKVDLIPPLLKDTVQHLVNWNILLKTCLPGSCIINIYNKGDCVPPHVDHHDILHPFHIVPFTSDADILFG
jgi:mRNA N6-methyladenine demethylase